MKILNRLTALFGTAALIFGIFGCSEEKETVHLKELSLSSFPDTISQNVEYTVIPVFNPGNADNKKYSIEADQEWVTIQSNKIIASDTGSFNLKVISEENSAITAEKEITVEHIAISGLSFASSTLNVPVGRDTNSLAPIFEPLDTSDRNLTWTSSDTEIATVNSQGIIKGLKEGTVTITVASTVNSEIQASFDATIIPILPAKLAVKVATLKVQAGGSCDVIPVFTPEDTTNKKVTYECSNANVTVTEEGVVSIPETGVTGTVTVTVKSVADPTKKATARISVITSEEWIIDENDYAAGFISATTSNGTEAPVKTNNLANNSWSGAGYLDSLGTGSVLYSVFSPKAQEAEIYISYAYWGAKGAARVAQLVVNGKLDDEFIYCNWTNKALGKSNVVKVNLDAGENQIRLTPVAKDTVCHIKENNEAGIVYPDSYTPGQNDGYGNFGDGKADGNLPNVDYISIKAEGLGGSSNELAFYKVIVNSDFGSASFFPEQDYFKPGTEVTITALPQSGYKFDCWTGDATSNENPFTITIQKDTALNAHFIPADFDENSGIEGYATICDDNGFAKYTVTGGFGGQEIEITSLTDWTNKYDLIKSDTPKIIKMKARISTLDFKGNTTYNSLESDDAKWNYINKSLSYDIGGNTTLIGEPGKDYGFQNINIKIGKENIIVKNLHFGDVIGDDYFGGSGNDAMSIKGGQHVWIDHCEFSSHLNPTDVEGYPLVVTKTGPDYVQVGNHKFPVDLEGENTDARTKWAKDFYDGLLDISEQSRFISVSNSYFHDHWKACLCGGSNDKAETQPQGSQVRLTMYNNYFKNIHARQPLFRFGKAHIYSSYIKGTGDSTGIEVRAESKVYVDNVYFEDVRSDRAVGCWNSSSGLGQGDWKVVNCTGVSGGNSGSVSTPPYIWTKTSATDSRTNLPNTAGIEK